MQESDRLDKLTTIQIDRQTQVEQHTTYYFPSSRYFCQWLWKFWLSIRYFTWNSYHASPFCYHTNRNFRLVVKASPPHRVTVTKSLISHDSTSWDLLNLCSISTHNSIIGCVLSRPCIGTSIISDSSIGEFKWCELLTVLSLSSPALCNISSKPQQSVGKP